MEGGGAPFGFLSKRHRSGASYLTRLALIAERNRKKSAVATLAPALSYRVRAPTKTDD
jgi:hypothetical protein